MLQVVFFVYYSHIYLLFYLLMSCLFLGGFIQVYTFCTLSLLLPT